MGAVEIEGGDATSRRRPACFVDRDDARERRAMATVTMGRRMAVSACAW